MPPAKKSSRSRRRPSRRAPPTALVAASASLLVLLALGLALAGILGLGRPSPSAPPGLGAEASGGTEPAPGAGASATRGASPSPARAPSGGEAGAVPSAVTDASSEEPPAALGPGSNSLAAAEAALAAEGRARAAHGSSPVSLRLPPTRPELPPAGRRAKVLIFVIDDAGNNRAQLEPFLRLPFPLTVAVLPELPYSRADAAAVLAAGKELILHLPMEALGGQNPGPGAIRLGMGREEVEKIVDADLQTVPGALGMNNHMGSAVTTDPELMDMVATIAKRRGIYYLDSLTIPGTATAEAAKREGIRYWERSVFLDNSPDRASILQAVEEGKRRAAKGGPAIMIGHVWSAELAQTLMDLYPQLVEEGFSLSTISRFMIDEAEEDDARPRD